MFKTMFFTAIIALLTLSSCKKEALDDMTLLTTGKWKITAQTRNGVDVLNPVRNCEADDSWQFTASGNITIDNGATKCAASDPQTQAVGRWSLSGTAPKRFIIIEDTSPYNSSSYDIVELTGSVFKITYVETRDTYVSTFGK